MTSAIQIGLKRRPEGLPQDDTWERTDDAPQSLEDGEIAVEVEFVSVDPAMRGWINDVGSYVPPVGIGEVMRARGVGTVTTSKSDKFASEMRSSASRASRRTTWVVHRGGPRSCRNWRQRPNYLGVSACRG